MAKKQIRSTPTAREISIQGGNLYFEDCLQFPLDTDQAADELDHCKAIRVISLDYAWSQTIYAGQEKWREEINPQMTLRAENRSGRIYWYAYRRVFGKLYKKYVGDSSQVTNKRLLEIARKMPSK